MRRIEESRREYDREAPGAAREARRRRRGDQRRRGDETEMEERPRSGTRSTPPARAREGIVPRRRRRLPPPAQALANDIPTGTSASASQIVTKALGGPAEAHRRERWARRAGRRRRTIVEGTGTFGFGAATSLRTWGSSIRPRCPARRPERRVGRDLLLTTEAIRRAEEKAAAGGGGGMGGMGRGMEDMDYWCARGGGRKAPISQNRSDTSDVSGAELRYRTYGGPSR